MGAEQSNQQGPPGGYGYDSGGNGPPPGFNPASRDTLQTYRISGVNSDAAPWAVFITDEQEYITYSNDDYGFSVDYPASWEEEVQRDDDEKFEVVFSAGRFATILVEVRNILEATGGKPATLKQWRRFNKRQFNEDPDMKILREDDAMLGPLLAFGLTVKITHKGNNVKNRMLSAVNASGSLAYAVTAACDTGLWDVFLPIFNGSLNSFSLDARCLELPDGEEAANFTADTQAAYAEPEPEPEPEPSRSRPGPSKKVSKFESLDPAAIDGPKKKKKNRRQDDDAGAETLQVGSGKSNKAIKDTFKSGGARPTSEKADYRRSYANPNNWFTYHSKRFKFSVDYAPSWEKKPTPNGVTFSAGEDSFATIVVEVKDILRGNDGRPMNLAQWKKFNVGQFSAAPNIDLVDESDQESLGDLPAFDLILVVDTGEDQHVKNKVRSAVTAKGNTAYVVTMATREDWFPEFAPVVSKFLNSFALDGASGGTGPGGEPNFLPNKRSGRGGRRPNKSSSRPGGSGGGQRSGKSGAGGKERSKSGGRPGGRGRGRGRGR